MYMKHKASGSLIEVLDMAELGNPFCRSIAGRLHAGEELQDPADFAKEELVFPSGETLPRCWYDPNYKSVM